MKALPLFNLSKYSSGSHYEEFNVQQHPYGSLAGRVMSAVYRAKDMTRFGLESSYDPTLRGKNGIVHHREVLSKSFGIMDTPPVGGADIVTTVDVSMQDLAERAVISELKKINGNAGVALVMEMAIGDIKAAVNMGKCFDGEYRGVKNHAIGDLLESGSVFKVASIMTASDDGAADTTARVETTSGVRPMYGRHTKDHDWRRDGYGLLTLPQALPYNSNIGISRTIDDNYRNRPEELTRGTYRVGLAGNLNIPSVGSSPVITRPSKRSKRGQWLNWGKTALSRMSIDYETQILPISTTTFYSAVANSGKMMQPRFVKEAVENGEMLTEFPPRVLRSQICRPKTLGEIQTILEHVINQGLGKEAGLPSSKVADKMGMAQIPQGSGGYKVGRTNYLLSFIGYFPADKPRYSCIVYIQKSGLLALGGGISGTVFHHISEGVMAQSPELDVKDTKDSTLISLSDVRDGNVLVADYVLSYLGTSANQDWSGSYTKGSPIWSSAEIQNNTTVKFGKVKMHGHKFTPNTEEMGARDAVYILESRGVRVKLDGCGKVISQSPESGHSIKGGDVRHLTLQQIQQYIAVTLIGDRLYDAQ